jgi:hypothetical protein
LDNKGGTEKPLLIRAGLEKGKHVPYIMDHRWTICHCRLLNAQANALQFAEALLELEHNIAPSNVWRGRYRQKVLRDVKGAKQEVLKFGEY